MLATVKLGTYNGSSPLETHLVKLDNCADYYQWSERDRLCHMKDSLKGHAGQVFWDAPNDAGSEDGGSGNKHGRVRCVNSVSTVLTPAQFTWIQRLEDEVTTQRKVVQKLRSDLSKMIGGQSRPSTPPQPVD